MIEVFNSHQLIADQVVYRDPSTNSADLEAVEQMAGTVLLTADKREFTQLLEQVLLFLVEELSYQLHGVYVENFPQYKNRLRSYRGLLPGISKKLPKGVFVEKEFNIPDNQSLFIGLLKVNQERFPLFLEELVDTRLAFGILVKPNNGHSLQHPQSFLESVFSEVINLDTPVYVDLLKSLAQIIQPDALLFNISKDGQSRIHLGIYGAPLELSEAMNELLPHLKKNFHLRHRRRGFDYQPREGAA